MTRRKNTKRFDPRYFLHERPNREEELQENEEKGHPGQSCKEAHPGEPHPKE